MVRGKHDIRIGGMIRANELNTVAVGFPNGFWVIGNVTGDAEADLLTGQTAIGLHDQEFGGTNTGRRWKLYRPFVQDDWRVSKNLTLNLGLAWAMVTPESEVGNRHVGLQSRHRTVPGRGSECRSERRHQDGSDRARAAPGRRLETVRRSNTVVRGGYAIYHDSSWNMGAQGLWQNPPYYAESFEAGGNMSQGFQHLHRAPVNPADFEGTILLAGYEFQAGQNSAVQRQCGTGTARTGCGDRRLCGLAQLPTFWYSEITSTWPRPAPAEQSQDTRWDAVRMERRFGVPYPAFPYSEIDSIFDAGRAHYNSLQIKAETKSARHGLYALIGYTYSRAYDTGFSDGLGSIIGATYFPLPNWQNLDWGLSQINLNHNFTASIIYQLPFGKGQKWGSNWNGVANAIGGGWEMTVIEKATSGFPVFVVDSNNTSGAGLLNTNAQSLIRPNQICNPVLSNPTLSEWFNPACFAQPARGTSSATRTGRRSPALIL